MITVKEQTVKVWGDQIQSRIKMAGEGSPLVFLHNAYGLVWDPFLDSLAQHYTVYAPEHPGTTPGNSEAIRFLDNLWDLVLYYYELFDQLGLQAPAVVGHSFGGMVAAEVAATNPDRVSHLVLISPIGLWRDDTPVKNWMSMAPEAVARAVFYDPEGPLATRFLSVPDDPQAQVEVQIQRIWTLGCTGKFVWPIPDKGLKKRLHRIHAPTLIIWGQQDGLVSPVYAREFAHYIAHARVEILDKAAHMPHLEQLTTVSHLIRDFLQR
ncbi:MAG TPA: alpha/beta hydrolase [Candidatus Limnocylindrales bacterium]|nr:alpha/beta hydrolase [Candidatus Limnocylindrales bacterium]